MSGPVQDHNDLHQNPSLISVGDVRCEWVNHYQKMCYCDINLLDPDDRTRITKRTITLNGTDCAPRNECEEDNGGCAHLCEDNEALPDGYRCKCFPPPAGHTRDVWTLSDNKYDCLDVDECEDNTFEDLKCSTPRKCVNTPGFYFCRNATHATLSRPGGPRGKSGQIKNEGNYQ